MNINLTKKEMALVFDLLQTCASNFDLGIDKLHEMSKISLKLIKVANSTIKKKKS